MRRHAGAEPGKRVFPMVGERSTFPANRSGWPPTLSHPHTEMSVDRSVLSQILDDLRAQRSSVSMDMRAAFQADPQRFSRFSAKQGDMLLDWSKCAVDDTTMALLGKVADACGV